MLKPQHKRRVGQGLSLEKFAGSKSSTFDKQRLIHKQKVDRIKRAKDLKKVTTKLISEGKLPAPSSQQYPLGSQDTPEPSAGDEESHPADNHDTKKQLPTRKRKAGNSTDSDNVAEQHPGPKDGGDDQQPGPSRNATKKRLKISNMQALANSVQQQKASVAQQEQAARLAAEQRQAQLREAEKRRKSQKSQFFKKTKRGQPVMKFRVDKILQQLGSS